ncbi:MAG: glycosyltransferase [Planctomycetes bacterium]|nr:glycosyltransferase [Planctomycetota bacterium]
MSSTTSAAGPERASAPETAALRPDPRNASVAGPVPDLSVLVPTFQREDLVEALLARLARQTLASERFEVIVVDDGSEPAITLDRAHPFHVVLLRQENSGPAAARNLGLARCRAPLTLILNDDAVPAEDLLERHLAIHAEERAEGRGPVAVLGTFHFSPSAVAASPFVELLDRTDLLFDFSTLKHGERGSWTHFWTCNVSLSTQALRDVGGFDAATFTYAVGEDVELGWRLERRGFRVLFRADAHAFHDHVWTPGEYFRRGVKLGCALARMHRKHGEPLALRLKPGERADAAWLRRVQATYEALHPTLAKIEAVLAKVEIEQMGRTLPDALVAQLAQAVARVNTVPFHRGVLTELTGHDPEPVMQSGPRTGRLTSIVIVSYDALASTQACIAALRRHREAEHPIELLVVDNGSKDGSRAWLAAQPDVTLIANDANHGAPAARNQAIVRARGEHVVFLDNDVVVTERWLSGLLFHADVDARAACVGPVTDRAAHGQAIEYAGGDAGLDAFAKGRALAHRRQFRHASLLSSFCLLVKRSVLDALGGFDPAFSPWGFEDDDFTLRAALEGRHNRVALDVFVQHKAYRTAEKAERHTQLLERNWERFRAKWKLPPDAKRGDYAALAPVLEGRAPHAPVHVSPSMTPHEIAAA